MTHPETVTPARQAEDGPAGSVPHDSIPPRRRVWPVGIRALRHRNYRLFFTGQLISVVGTWMQSAAQAWLVYRLTGSALLLGLVGFADRAPVLVFGLAGGLVADRFDRRSVVLVTQMLLL
ncbi:MAG TPA: MFS transporter, partial [Candidatus Polarisedimenticolia bacterium]|nr:MFS transporter [Candidatus Polarisedimenticolia bacterium]